LNTSAVVDAVRTSLGPRGMDKMIQIGNGEVTITNDEATILKHKILKLVMEQQRLLLSLVVYSMLLVV
jgi:chaperonin GroEL (HSP60 family)